VTDTRRSPRVHGGQDGSRRAGEAAATPVLVIAANELLAAGVEAKLRGNPGWRVVIGTLPELVDLVDDHDPAIVVLAVPSQRVARTLEALGRLSRIPPVILLTSAPHGAWSGPARRAGVRAVLGSDPTSEELVAALVATTAGLVVLHPDVFSAPPATVSESPGARGTTALTPRELEILEMMAEGMSNRTIAARLGISGYTVKFHVASILDKVGAASRTEAVTLGVRHGIISL
jgi:NarL family two-component system response regulator YdfI